MRGMGFRNLYDANLTLLDKQVWRLIILEGSFVSRVMKVRYCPKGTFLWAKIGVNPSFIWSNIFVTQELMCHNIRRAIGSMDTTIIMHTTWLLGTDLEIHTDS